MLILAAMVFALTFAMNYLDQGPNRPVKKGLGAPRLAFANPVFPPDGAPPQICEYGTEGFHDFWFENPGADELSFGLLRASCKCSHIELYLVPERAYPELAVCEASWRPSVMPVGMGSFESLAGLPVLTRIQQEKAARDLEGRLEGQPVTQEDTRKVPGKAIGWLRLHWKADQPDLRRLLQVDLWMDRRQNDLTARLEAGVMILPPVLAKLGEPTLAGTDVRGLPRSWPVYCFSGTRPDLRVEAEVDHDGRPAKSDPLVVAGVERLGDAEMRGLESSSVLPSNARCAYRVTARLLESAPDGTPCELGRFRRIVRVKAGDAAEAQPVVLEGEVPGDVVVGARKAGGSVELGSFPAGRGAAIAVPLQSDVPGLELEVDAARTSAFLDVPPLQEPEVAPSGHRTWKLVVRVQPNRVFGKFPRDDDPALRDSAVYIRRKGGPPRTIRIPVLGTANSG